MVLLFLFIVYKREKAYGYEKISIDTKKKKHPKKPKKTMIIFISLIRFLFRINTMGRQTNSVVRKLPAKNMGILTIQCYVCILLFYLFTNAHFFKPCSSSLEAVLPWGRMHAGLLCWAKVVSLQFIQAGLSCQFTVFSLRNQLLHAG